MANNRIPRDFDDSTGRYLQTSGKYSVSRFSGYYRVLTVESEFRGGKFTQTLDLVRYRNQPVPVDPDAKNTPVVRASDEVRPTSDNSQVSKNDVEQAPDVDTTDPLAANNAQYAQTAAPEDTTDPLAANNAQYALSRFAEDTPANNPLDQKLSDVVTNGAVKTLSEATSPDGNVVPIQTA